MPARKRAPVKKPPKEGPPARIPPPVPPERLEQVIQWVLKGHREHEIEETVRETWPDQNLEALWSAIGKHFLELAHAEDPDAVRGWAIAATQDVYAQMRSVGDLVGSLRAIRQLLEISGG